MKNLIVLLTCLGLLLTFSNCKTKDVEDVLSSIVYHVNQMNMEINGSSISFGLAMPDTFQDGNSYPLVLALHYGGTPTSTYGADFLNLLVTPALGDLEAIMIAPNCPGNGWTDPVSVAAVNDIMDWIRNMYNIDSSRIIITGFSMGGIGTWYFAATYPGVFAVAIPMASVPSQGIIDTISGIPLYVIQGEQDEIFSIAAIQNAVNALLNRGVSVQLEIIPGLSHYNTGGYVPALKETVSWIRSNW